MHKRAALFFLALLTGAPALAETAQVRGITGPVEIVTDRWGIPHITAQTQADAFFGQGYAAATARLWQMDLVRRRLLGRLAAAFGSDFLPFDEAARTVAFRGDIAAEWPRQAPGVPALAQAWVAGINARIAEVLADPTLLPPEFRAMDMLPEPWAADELILMRYSSAPNVRAEMRRALLACRDALELDALVHPLEPAGPPPRLPEGLEPCRLRREQLALHDRLTAPLPFPRTRQRSDLGPAGTPLRLPADDIDARQGSNGWVIAPHRSPTGRPILANDPHLGVSVPGPRFITHLRAPGLDAIGAAPAFRPGFQFGHNDRIAHGRTDFQVDQEDLYLLQLNEDGSAFQGPQGWEPVTRITERIEIRGVPAVERVIGQTRLGPIIFEDRAARHALALRSVHLEPGPAVTLEYIAVILARNWEEYRAALRFAAWGSNYLYADIEGNIGWQTAGRAPRRPRHDGLLPVPAAGDFPWEGELPLEQMIGAYNPPEGWIATANQMPFPPDWPAAQLTSREWIANDRYRRVAQVLAGQARHGVAEALALQEDTLSLRAQALIPLLEAPADWPAEAALLRGWDARMEADSAAAALYALWWSELGAALRTAVVPEPLRNLATPLHPHVVLALAARPEHRPVLVASLNRAAQRFRALPVDARSWGDLHRVNLRHSLSALIPGADVTGGRSGGDGATVMARWWVSADAPNVTGGASFRAVLDVGNWDAARGINLPGQSGDPRSPHYADLYPLWIANETIPLPYARERVQEEAGQVLILTPRPGVIP